MGVELSKTFANGSSGSWKNTNIFFCPLFALQLQQPTCLKPCDSGSGRRISQRFVMDQECVKNHGAISNSPFFSSHFKTRPASATPVWCDQRPAVWHRVREVHSPQGVACDFPKPKQAIFLSFPLSFFSPFRLGRMQHHRPCHPELRGQQPYAFRPALAFLGKLQPAGHFLSESLREKGWDVAQAGVPLVLSRGGGKGEEGEEPGLPKRRRRRAAGEARLASSCAGGWPAPGQPDEPAGPDLSAGADCSDGPVWWLGHQRSLSRSAASAAAGEEGMEEVKKPRSHTHAQIRDRKGRETALAPGY